MTYQNISEEAEFLMIDVQEVTKTSTDYETMMRIGQKVTITNPARRCHGNYDWDGKYFSDYFPENTTLDKFHPYAPTMHQLAPEAKTHQEVWQALWQRVIDIREEHGVCLPSLFVKKFRAEQEQNNITEEFSSYIIIRGYFYQLANMVDGIVQERIIYRTLQRCYPKFIFEWGSTWDEARDVDIIVRRGNLVLPISLKTGQAYSEKTITHYRNVKHKRIPRVYINESLNTTLIQDNELFNIGQLNNLSEIFAEFSITSQDYFQAKIQEQSEAKARRNAA